jgi:hypothetical protein
MQVEEIQVAGGIFFLVFVGWGGVRQSPLGTSATI